MKPSSINRLAYGYVLLGAGLWGTIGLFVDALTSAGFTALQIVALRVIMAAVMLVGWMTLTRPAQLRIAPKDAPLFAGTGIFSIVFFNWCYFTAINELSLSVAVILLYTGPVFVAILSWLLLGEPMTRRKVGALVLTFLGCILVIQIFPVTPDRISLYGLLVGLGSGLGYALYSIFGKFALRRYSSLTVITYTFVFASLAMGPVAGASIEWGELSGGWIWAVVAGLGFFPTALAYLLYTLGLAQVDSSNAAITATFEPVVATLIGVLVFQENLTGFQIGGMVLILGAVVLIQRRRPQMPVT